MDNYNAIPVVSFISTVFVAIGAICLLVDVLKRPPPTIEEKAISTLTDRCDAMAGRSHYDSKTKEFECWRHTWFVRTPKLVFKTTYKSTQ